MRKFLLQFRLRVAGSNAFMCLAKDQGEALEKIRAREKFRGAEIVAVNSQDLKEAIVV